MLRQRDDARAAVTIAARAAHVAQGNADGCFRVAAFHAQVQIDHAVATVACDHQPMVLRNERGFDLGPEPRIALGRQASIETTDRGQRVALLLPLAAHARYVVADFVVACVVAHRGFSPLCKSDDRPRGAGLSFLDMHLGPLAVRPRFQCDYRIGMIPEGGYDRDVRFTPESGHRWTEVQQSSDVRFESLADISQCNRHVRFTPKSRHGSAARLRLAVL